MIYPPTKSGYDGRSHPVDGGYSTLHMEWVSGVWKVWRDTAGHIDSHRQHKSRDAAESDFEHRLAMDRRREDAKLEDNSNG